MTFPDSSIKLNWSPSSLALRVNSSALKKRSSWEPGMLKHARPVEASGPSRNVPVPTSALPRKPLQPPVPVIWSAPVHRTLGFGSVTSGTPSMAKATHSVPDRVAEATTGEIGASTRFGRAHALRKPTSSTMQSLSPCCLSAMVAINQKIGHRPTGHPPRPWRTIWVLRPDPAR